MQAEYDGRQVVGIDLHRRRSVIVRMTETGDRLDSVRIDNDPIRFATEIAKAGENPQVVVEATDGWYWLVLGGRCVAGCRRRGASGASVGDEGFRVSAGEERRA